MAHGVPGARLSTHAVAVVVGGVSEGLGGHAAWGGLIMWGDGLRGALCVGCLAAMWMLP